MVLNSDGSVNVVTDKQLKFRQWHQVYFMLLQDYFLGKVCGSDVRLQHSRIVSALSHQPKPCMMQIVEFNRTAGSITDDKDI